MSSIRGIVAGLGLASLALLIVGLLIGSIVHEVAAQGLGDAWHEPVNLSMSAGTSDPVIVVDSSGIAHAIWNEGDSSFMYTKSNDGTWRVAQPIETPFGTRSQYPNLPANQAAPLHTPVLLAGAGNRIHAMWINNDGRLLHSSVTSADLADIEAWSEPTELAPSAIGSAAISDLFGGLHVVYGQSAESADSPAGLYYVGSSDGGETWSTPSLLYESPYFRSLRAEQVDVQLASAANGILFAAWDNPFLERVYVTRSDNSGRTWNDPETVDVRTPEDGAEATGPNSITIETAGEKIHLLWQAGHDGLACAQYHQLSTDGGQTWQRPTKLAMPDESCALASFLVRGEGENILLMSAYEDEVYLSAWDGTQWGETKSADALASFVNPLNFREVKLDCQRMANGAFRRPSDQGAVIWVGCDTNGGGDIWAQTADLDALMEEMKPQTAPIWQRPSVLSSTTDGESLKLLADADGWLHAMWAQPISTEVPQRAVHYSRWDGIGWSQPRDVLSPAEGRETVQPVIALAPGGKILAVWVDEVPGSVHFSQADLARAGNASEWSSPIVLPMPGNGATAPQIAVGQDGSIFVAYTVPLNEGRGVYVTRSDDGGETWANPRQVFDGAVAGWDMVDTPRIAAGVEGTVHLMWTRYSSPPAADPQSMHYSRSLDGGGQWSEATEVAQVPGAWGDLLAVGDLVVHRFWLAENDDVWHQISSDSGASWGQPQRVSSSSDMLPIVDAVLDGAGRPWILQAAGTRTEANQLRPPNLLRSWVFADGRWSMAEDLSLGDGELTEIAAATTGGGDMNVVFSAMIPDSDAGADLNEQTIFFSRRVLDLPQVQPTAVPTLTPTLLPAATATPTRAPQPTATISFSTDADGQSGLPIPVDTSNPLTGPLLGIIPAAAVVLVAFFVGVRLLRGERRK